MAKIRVRDFVVTQGFVEVKEGLSVPVRPLTLPEIITLLMDYRESFLSMYTYASAGVTDPSVVYGQFAVAAPEMVVDIIMMSAGFEEDEREDVRNMGLMQAMFLAKIWEISVPDPKKLKEALAGIIKQLANLQLQAQGPESPPPGGVGASIPAGAVTQ